MTQQVRFTHNNRNSRLRYTVAYSFDKNADGSLNVTYGVAQCRKGDSFNRADGRKMAQARMQKALSGKVAAPTTSNGILTNPSVPMYGKLSVTDYAGLSVGKLVSETFETHRNQVLALRNNPVALLDSVFGEGFSNAFLS